MRRLHPLVGLARALQYAVYGLGVPLFALSMARFVFEGAADVRILLPVMGIGLLLGLAYGVASYFRYTYRVTDDALEVASGVLGRREREIPHRRIQNVDVTRNVWQKAIGLAVVRVETAGGGSTEARLDFVSAGEATRLERVLRERRAAARDAAASGDVPDSGTSVEPATTGETTTGTDARAPRALFALSDAELALHAATTFRPGALFVIVIGTPLLEGVVTDLLLSAAAPIGGPERLAPGALTPDSALALAVVGVPSAVVGAWLIGIAFGVNQYYGFRLGRRGEELVYDRGFLSEFSGTIPLGKIQTLTVTENVLQRALGYAGLSIDTAGYAGGNSQEAGTRSAVPLATRARVVALVDELESANLDATFVRPPKRARERYAVRYAIALAALLCVSFAASRLLAGFSLWWTPALLAPAIPVIAHLKWKHRGYALTEDHLLVRSGFLRRRTRVVPYWRLQTITRSRTPFQRRRRLASLVADTASGGVLNRVHPVAYDQDDDEMRDLQNRLRERLQASLREQ